LPDDGKRYEVINGELVMVAAPNTFHQVVSGNLEYLLKSFLQKNKIGKIFHAPIDVFLENIAVVQPDILFITNGRSDIITEKNIHGAPDLIIEILSPGTAYYDLIGKKEIYEKFAVKEYWIVDPIKQRIEIFENKNNEFELAQKLELGGIARSSVVKGFEASLKDIFSLE
jgi:Uma2 family endonuclease